VLVIMVEYMLVAVEVQLIMGFWDLMGILAI